MTETCLLTDTATISVTGRNPQNWLESLTLRLFANCPGTRGLQEYSVLVSGTVKNVKIREDI